MKKILIYLLLVIVGIVGFFSYVEIQKSFKENKLIKVGVSQIVSHVGIDDVRRGIVAGFLANGYKEGENIIFDFQNAQGDSSVNQSIAQKFANGNYDVLIPIGTQSSQAIKNLIQDKPIVFAAVTDPVTSWIIKF